MDYRTFVILFILSKFASERSVSGIYHLLTGKKSSQTIQDGRFFDVLFLFYTMNHIKREDVDESISYLEKHRFIEQKGNEHYAMTSKGKQSLKEIEKLNPFSEYLDGWKYHEKANIFWKRYSFIVQCLSNLIAGNHSFLPITRDRDIQLWAKKIIPRTMESRNNIAQEMYKETEVFLNQLDPIDANYFVLRLTSINKVGYTHEQCALILDMECDYGRMRFQSILHRLLHEIESEEEKYSNLQLFISDFVQSYPLTNSTRRTYELLINGRNLTEISRLRKLKMNTIEDHIVEIAINIPTINIDLFVDQEKQASIIAKISLLKTKRLKIIKDQLADDISYFQIRLVMARL